MAGDSAKGKRAVVAVLVGLAALAVVIGGLAAAGVFTDDGSGSAASAPPYTVTTVPRAEASATQPPGTTGVTPSSSGTATGDWVARAAAICAATGQRLSGQIQPNPDNDPQIRADGWTLTGQALVADGHRARRRRRPLVGGRSDEADADQLGRGRGRWRRRPRRAT